MLSGPACPEQSYCGGDGLEQVEVFVNLEMAQLSFSLLLPHGLLQILCGRNGDVMGVASPQPRWWLAFELIIQFDLGG